MVLLVAGLWRLQVLAAQRYVRSEEAQSVRLVRVPAMRGRILDRNGFALAENRPSFDVNLYLEELRPAFSQAYTNRVLPQARAQHPGVRFTLQQRFQLQEWARLWVYTNTVGTVAGGLGVPIEASVDRFLRHYRQDLALPLPVKENLTPGEMALFFERCQGVPGVDLEVQAARTYPFGRLAAHVLGHLQRADEADNDPDESVFRYRLRDYRGVAGLEYRYDEQLRGRAGVKALRVNSQGYRHEESILQPTEPGVDVRLTLDVPLQMAAEKALTKIAGAETRGAVVVMDVRTGDLLALVSLPAFDPNRFLGGLTPEEFAELNDEKQTPQMNRAVSGRYAPGSIFKIVVALAALEAGTLDPDAWKHYLGYWPMGPKSPPMKDTAPAGEYDFKRAFKRSSNAYFADHGTRTGRERIVEMARRFGLGKPTGFPIGVEAATDLPDETYLEKLRVMRDPWTDGDTANLSIGQGALTVTPLQMAVMTAAVANGGHVLEPRIVQRVEPANGDPSIEFEPRVRGELGVKPEHLELIRKVMLADVEEPEGTGREAAVEGMRLCGKTGTAEVKRGRVLVDKITWFVCFGPFEAPRYAVAVVVESGGSGGKTCAPVAAQIFRTIRQREAAAGVPPSGPPGGRRASRDAGEETLRLASVALADGNGGSR
jgi:penicillin-binding protein 2